MDTTSIDLRDPATPVDQVRRLLSLIAHPEGGHYREVWRAEAEEGARPAASSILFLLATGERSQWHRVHAAEIWLWHAGAPLRLQTATHGSAVETLLGPDVQRGEQLQATVALGEWQAAETLGAWTLVSCVVAPAFDFSGFELAPQDWSPINAA